MTDLVDFYRKQRAAQGAQAAIGLTNDPRSPDALAEQARIGQQLGVPPIVVGSDPDAYKARAEKDRLGKLLADAPRTAQWLADRDNGGIAKDDVENLSWFERNVLQSPGALTRAGGRGVVRAGAALPALEAEMTADVLADVGKTAADMYAEEIAKFPGSESNPTIQADARRKAQMRFEALEGMSPANQSKIALRGSEALAEARAALDRAASVPQSDATKAFVDGPLKSADNTLMGVLRAFAADPVGGASFIAETAAESLPALVAATGVTALTRSPMAGAAAMGGSSFLLENSNAAMDFLAEKGADLSTPEAAMAVLQNPALMAEATERGLTRGLVVGVFDAISGGVAGKTLAKSPVGAALLQGVAQTLFGAGGEAAAQIASGQDFNWRDVVVEGLAELATAPIEAGGVAGKWLLGRTVDATTAGDTAKALDAVDAQAGASKLKQRDAARFADAVANGSDGAMIYVPAEDLQTYFQAKDTGFDPLEWGIEPDILAEAVASGGRVAVPMSAYAAKISGTTDAAWFKDNATIGEDEMSLAEAARFNNEVRDIVESQMADMDRNRAMDDAARDADVQVYDRLYSSLRAAGRTQNVAQNEARVQTAFLRTIAERAGSDALAMSERFALAIRGPQSDPMRLRGNLDIAINTLRRGEKQKPGPSLLEFIKGAGGIRDTGGDLAAMDAPKDIISESREDYIARGQQGSMFAGGDAAKGQTIDQVARAAVDAGYFPDLMAASQDQEADVAAVLMDAIGRELSGDKAYIPGQEGRSDLAELEAEIGRRGLSLDMSNDAIAAGLETATDGDTYAQIMEQPGARDVMVSVTVDDGSVTEMAAGDVESALEKRMTAAQELLRCMNG